MTPDNVPESIDECYTSEDIDRMYAKRRQAQKDRYAAQLAKLARDRAWIDAELKLERFEAYGIAIGVGAVLLVWAIIAIWEACT